MSKRDHERLIVYGKAVRATGLAARLLRVIPEPWGDLRDQLRRASTSIVLNIAEGASEIKPREKARFYRLAKRSTAECMAVLDILAEVLERPAPTSELANALDEIAAMLTGLTRANLTAPDPSPDPAPAPEEI